ncbi:3-isopropylmalate dehydratase small subunit [Azospirillum endophyticum]
MQPFKSVTGPAAPLMRRDIDTDVIIRIDRLTQYTRGQLGPFALEALHGDDFVLSRPQFRRAPILLAGPNFGCGSSREAAVWALQEAGLRCVVAASFGDIFFSNCIQNGVLPVVLPEATAEALAVQAADGAPLTVDLETCTLTAPDGTGHPFTLDPMQRETLLEGLDELGLTLRCIDDIAAWERADALRRPWAAPTIRKEAA